jgi:hypothetical protein
MKAPQVSNGHPTFYQYVSICLRPAVIAFPLFLIVLAKEGRLIQEVKSFASKVCWKLLEGRRVASRVCRTLLEEVESVVSVASASQHKRYSPRPFLPNLTQAKRVNFPRVVKMSFLPLMVNKICIRFLSQ